MSVVLTAVPNPPAEYAVQTENSRMTLGEMKELVALAIAANVPNDFRLVNSGHGNYKLRKPF